VNLQEMIVHTAALELLAPFASPLVGDEERLARMRALEPRPGDAVRVFSPRLAERAHALHAQVWQAPPIMRPAPEQTVVQVAASLAEGLARAVEFPGGYRRLGAELVPGRIWVCWRFVAPGETSGLSFDGLVQLDDRFVWFPRPWLLLDV
jgi:hypothetical protein